MKLIWRAEHRLPSLAIAINQRTKLKNSWGLFSRTETKMLRVQDRMHRRFHGNEKYSTKRVCHVTSSFSSAKCSDFGGLRQFFLSVITKNAFLQDRSVIVWKGREMKNAPSRERLSIAKIKRFLRKGGHLLSIFLITLWRQFFSKVFQRLCTVLNLFLKCRTRINWALVTVP